MKQHTMDAVVVLGKNKTTCKRIKCCILCSRALLHRLQWRKLLERPPFNDLTPRVDGVAEDSILRGKYFGGKDKRMIQRTGE